MVENVFSHYNLDFRIVPSILNKDVVIELKNTFFLLHSLKSFPSYEEIHIETNFLRYASHEESRPIGVMTCVDSCTSLVIST